MARELADTSSLRAHSSEHPPQIVTGLILDPVVNEFGFQGPFLKLGQNIGLLVGAAFWGVGSDVWGRKYVRPVHSERIHRPLSSPADGASTSPSSSPEYSPSPREARPTPSRSARSRRSGASASAETCPLTPPSSSSSSRPRTSGCSPCSLSGGRLASSSAASSRGRSSQTSRARPRRTARGSRTWAGATFCTRWAG